MEQIQVQIGEEMFGRINKIQWICSVKGDVNYARLRYEIITIKKLIGNASLINGIPRKSTSVVLCLGNDDACHQQRIL